MQRHILFLAISLTLAAGCKPRTIAEKTKLQSKLDSLITEVHLADDFHGTLVVGSKDSVFFEKAIGIANRVWNIPMHLDHRFDVCSINKSFISSLVLMAVEEGRLALEDKLVDRISHFEYTGNFDPHITIHHMLCHLSGISDYTQVADTLLENDARLFKRKHFSNAQYVNFISQLPSLGKVDSQFYYSNFAYHLLSIILEDVYQQPFAELLDQKICKPLGLKHTFSTISDTEVFENTVEAYNYSPSTAKWNRNKFIDLTLGRRIFSSAYDLYLWGREVSSPTLLSQQSTQLMMTNHTYGVVPNISYGYGWVVFDGRGAYQMGNLEIDKKYIIHGGSTEGFKSMLINIEEGEYIVALLSNTGDQINEMTLASKIVKVLIELENEN
ncbi:MAG: serine hydrolase domain-containing protein [Bacteroidota bacterium]